MGALPSSTFRPRESFSRTLFCCSRSSVASPFKLLTVKMGDFLKQKFEFLFKFRYDVNGDGVVNFEDYEAVVTKLASAAGVGPGDHFYDETVRYQKEVFQFLMDRRLRNHSTALAGILQSLLLQLRSEWR